MHIKTLQPIGGVNGAHYTGNFSYTNSEITSYWPVNFPRRVAHWSSFGDRALRHRVRFELSASR